MEYAESKAMASLAQYVDPLEIVHAAMALVVQWETKLVSLLGWVTKAITVEAGLINRAMLH